MTAASNELNDMNEPASLLYPSVQIAIASAERLSTRRLFLDADFIGSVDKFAVMDVDGIPGPELIIPTGSNHPAAVGLHMPVWILKLAGSTLQIAATLSAPANAGIFPIGFLPGASKPVLFIPSFTDNYPQTAPSVLFTPDQRSGAYRTDHLDLFQSHGPNYGRFSDDGKTYVVVPAQWPDSQRGIWFASLDASTGGLAFSKLVDTQGTDYGRASSAVIPETTLTGPALFIGQTYTADGRVSDVIYPIDDSGPSPQIDADRPVQIFLNYWNIPSNFSKIAGLERVQEFEAVNPSNGNSSHVVYAVTCDLNSDGLPDILSVHAYRDPSTHLMQLVPYIQHPDGSFTQEANERFIDFDINQDCPYRLSVIDLNQDGHLDIAFGSVKWDTSDYPQGSNWGVYLNDGEGYFIRAADDPELISTFNYTQLIIVPGEDGGYSVLTNKPGSVWPPEAPGGREQPYFDLSVHKPVTNFAGPGGINPALLGVPGFNEWYYLRHHADAAEAVRSGAFKSGLDYYLAVGRERGDQTFAKNSSITGSSLMDTLVLAGQSADFSREELGRDRLQLTDASGRYGTLTLQGIERIQFDDLLLRLKSVIPGTDGNDVLSGLEDDDDLLGGAGNDKLTGFAGNDVLDGGSGSDLMLGGAGDDTYVVDSRRDKPVEQDGEGHDAVRTLLPVYTLGLHVESLAYIGDASFKGRGNALDNLITGGSGNDTLVGSTGADTFVITGGIDTVADLGVGMDTLLVNAGASVFARAVRPWSATAGTQNDGTAFIRTSGFAIDLSAASAGTGFYVINTGAAARLLGSAVGDSLWGGRGHDTLDGAAGNDRLIGGRGADHLAGGDGSDAFSFVAGDSSLASGKIDVIADFTKGAEGIGDVMVFASELSVGGADADASRDEASIDQATGVAAFDSGSGQTLVDAIGDIARRFSGAVDDAGEFAFFRVNDAGDYFLFISDGIGGVSKNDVVVQLSGVSSIDSVVVTPSGELLVTA